MYSLSSLQIVQAQAKMMAVPVIILYSLNTNIKENDPIQISIDKHGFWFWLRKETTPKDFSEYRLKLYLDNELFIFDTTVPDIYIKDEDTTNWSITQLDSNGNIIYAI